MLADVADEAYEAIVLHPVIVVDKLGLVGRIALKVEETAKLSLDASNIVVQCLLVEKVPLGRFHRGVANHSRRASDKGDGLVAAPLEVLENHDTYKVAYME